MLIEILKNFNQNKSIILFDKINFTIKDLLKDIKGNQKNF